MAVITGGLIIGPPAAGNTNQGIKQRIYRVSGVVTDALITASGITPANGMIGENILTNDLYERQAGAWVRIDTL
jgi:MOSC domain-containing protein YiiM